MKDDYVCNSEECSDKRLSVTLYPVQFDSL